jgi:hypothetical protein
MADESYRTQAIRTQAITERATQLIEPLMTSFASATPEMIDGAIQVCVYIALKIEEEAARQIKTARV